jgi:cephalosporin-C deacetylase-like acetyl esterase
LLLVLAGLSGAAAQNKEPPPNKELEALHAHFARVVQQRHDRLFSGITTTAQWERRKQQTRAALEKMLWYDMRWPAGVPSTRVTHREQHPTYRIENLVIETAPKLFLTANLYLPLGAGPFPIVLYQCGHASKSVYARHGAWFAANGIATLVMDNIEMGEVEFTHHGVYSRGWFHWYSRGFSPLAVELLNARRAVDYLVSRPDLDRNRIGATGRSGGGMTSFYLAALDERIKATAPVSGALSTTGWVSQRLSAAHCDCQFPVNSYGLLYSEIGALVAPRAQLLANADADRGFPMDAFSQMVDKMRQIYTLYHAAGALQTAVAPGGHSDTEPIRLPVYSFFLKEFLGRESPVGAEGPVDIPTPEELICYRNGAPLDERLTRIDEELFDPRPPRAVPAAADDRRRSAEQLASTLRGEVFRYFPSPPAPLQPEWTPPVTAQGRTVQKVSFSSVEGVRVKATYSRPATASAADRLPAILLVDHRKGIPVWGNEQPLDRIDWGARAVLVVETLDRGSRVLEQNLRSAVDDDLLHHMRREAMVAGTSIESLQVYEVMRSLELLRSLPNVDAGAVTIVGKGEDGVNGMYAALLDGARTHRVVLQSPTPSHLQGPHYLGVLRYTDVAETANLFGDRLRVFGEVPDSMRWGRSCESLIECLSR